MDPSDFKIKIPARQFCFSLKHEVGVHVQGETETLLPIILKYFTLGNPAVSNVLLFNYAPDSINAIVSRL
jgi:hypothetical protein